MLLKRIITGIIGIAALVYIINSGGTVFAVCISVLALIAWREYVLIMKAAKHKISTIRAYLAILLIVLCAWKGNEAEYLAVTVLSVIAFSVFEVLAGKRANFIEWAVFIAGFIYITFGFSHIIMLRDAGVRLNLAPDSGWQFMWLAFIATWASDTMAFFVGRAIGKHKLSPAISPGKTIEGAIGGVVGSVAAAVIAAWFFAVPFNIAVGIGLIAGILGPCGDLFESMLKRYAGVKDSGNLLPGHGGVLDRFDSIILVAPAVYYYLYLIYIPF